MEPKKTQAILATTLASLFWGSSFVVNKIGLAYVDAYTFAFLRFLVAAVTILAITIPLRKLQWGIFRNRLVWVVGGLNAGGFLLQYLGLTYTTASKAALLINASFILVPIISRAVFRENFPTTKKVAIALGLLGALLLTTEGDLSIVLEGTLLGDLLILLAGGVWAFFMIGNKQVVNQHSEVLPLTSAMMTLTAVFLFPFSIFLGTTPVVTIIWEGWLAILFTGVFCSLLAFFLWSTGLKGLNITDSAIILLLEIIWAVILAFLFLGEVFSLIAATGGLILLTSIFFVAKD